MPEHTPIPAPNSSVQSEVWEHIRQVLNDTGRTASAGDVVTFRGVPVPVEQELPQSAEPPGTLCNLPSDSPEEVCHRRVNLYSHRPRRTRDNTDEEYDNYISQNGFTEVPLIRGFDVISYLWKILYDVSNFTKKDCFIAGGYARYCASPKVHPIFPGDVDVYSEDTNTFGDIYSRLRSELRIQNESKYAIEFVVPESGPYHYMPPIHLIIPKVDNTYVTMGDKETILSNFDFSIIRCAIESPTSVLVDVDFKHDELGNILRIKKIRKPIHVMARCMKYASKGYYLEPKEAVKLFEAWTELSDKEKQIYLKEIE